MLVRTLLRAPIVTVTSTTRTAVVAVRAVPIVYSHHQRTLATATTTPAATIPVAAASITEPATADATSTVGTSRNKAKSRHSMI